MADFQGRRAPFADPFGWFYAKRTRSKSEPQPNIPIPIESSANDALLLDESSPLLETGTLKLSSIARFNVKDDYNQGVHVPPSSVNGDLQNYNAPSSVELSTTSNVARRLPSIAEEESLPAPPTRRKMTSLDQVPLFASIATGTTLEDSLNILNLTPEEVSERLQEVGDLINRLEDTAALLRQHLHSTKHAFEAHRSGNIEPKPIMTHVPWVLKYHLPIIAVIQLLCVTILAMYDHWLLSKGKHYTILIDTVMVILEVIIVLEVILATVELSRKLLKYGVPGSFLAQTYFSTVLAFAGVYFMIYRFDRTSWDIGTMINEGAAFSEFIRMLYLSVSSATLCGAANIQPAAWYTTMLVCMQSLINFVYFASILAQTIGNYHSYTVHIQRTESLSRSMSTAPVHTPQQAT